MESRHRIFSFLLKEKKNNMFVVHFVLHNQHLVAKRLSPRQQKTLGVDVKALKKVKANAKNDQLFRQLCQANDEEFERLLLHIEIRW